MTLSNYLRTILRGWKGATTVFLLGMALTMLYTQQQPEVYAATSSGFVTSGIQPESAGDQLSLHGVAKDRAASYVDLATSTATAEEAVKLLRSSEKPGDLLGQIDVTQPLDTVLIHITARGSTPEEAKKLADAWIQALSIEVKGIEDPKNGGKSLLVRPVERAELPVAPVSPDKRTNLIVGGIASLLAALAYALWAGQRPRPLANPTEVIDAGGPRLLASLPAGAGPDILELAPSTHSKESYRKLRTSLQATAEAGRPRTLVLAGIDEGASSSVVAVRLAEVLAAAGQKVALIDANLRGPGVSTLLGIGDRHGLSEALSGITEPSEIGTQVKGLGNVMVFPSGAATDGASELLSQGGMQELLSELCAEGWETIVSAPPVRPVTDAAVLGSMASGVVLVLDAGQTWASDAQASVNEIEAAGGSVVGSVLTGAKAEGSGEGRRHLFGRK